ncbi:hypothetical protein EVAR_87790_1 [Eumeta japonica]|uniref:Reverse transcriptase domain-containing protein n=1 Tax=Eumeta variegata TaxID=151549 RepID=A0A4C1X5C7_EUMVA|nr:hypothetical protein EVAR_87790_1 [Eumeta japonica]
MTFGLRNAGQTFQSFVDELTKGLNFCFAYLDDILVYSKVEEKHEKDLKQIFGRIREYRMLINIRKCVFGADYVIFLGYNISAKRTRPPEQKVDSIKNFLVPKTVMELRRFLGMINFYRRFIPNAARNQAPLNAFLTGFLKKSHPVRIIGEVLKALDTCKDSLCHAFLIVHPHCNAKLSLITDASDTSLGAVLQQYKDKAWEPLEFYSIPINLVRHSEIILSMIANS